MQDRAARGSRHRAVDIIVTLLVWSVAPAAVAIAATYTDGPHTWVGFGVAVAEFGLVFGVMHLAIASMLRRWRAQREGSRTAP